MDGQSTNLAFNHQKLYEECQCPQDEKDKIFAVTPLMTDALVSE